MQFPLWATPKRRAYLVELFQKSRGFCVYGHPLCPDPHHHYAYFIDGDDLVVETTEMVADPQPCSSSETGWTMAGRPIPVCRKVHLPGLIDDWKADDRARRAYLWQLEEKRLHAAPNKRIRRGQFDSIRREQYLAGRSVFRIVGVGVSAFTQRRIAQVEIPSLHTTIWVDLSGIFLTSNKRKLHKLARYKRGAVPKGLVDDIYARCRKAVEQYLNS